MTRPDREVIAAAVFDEQGRIRPEMKTKCDWQLRCDRRKHTLAVALRTTFGWWVAWREPHDGSGPGWNHNWLDEIIVVNGGAVELRAGGIEAECNCRRRRRVDPSFARLL